MSDSLFSQILPAYLQAQGLQRQKTQDQQSADFRQWQQQQAEAENAFNQQKFQKGLEQQQFENNLQTQAHQLGLDKLAEDKRQFDITEQRKENETRIRNHALMIHDFNEALRDFQKNGGQDVYTFKVMWEALNDMRGSGVFQNPLGLPGTPAGAQQPAVMAPNVMPPPGSAGNPLMRGAEGLVPNPSGGVAGFRPTPTIEDQLWQEHFGRQQGALMPPMRRVEADIAAKQAEAALKQAQTQKTQEQAETERRLREPRYQDLVSRYTNRDFLAKETKAYHDARLQLDKERQAATNTYHNAVLAQRAAQQSARGTNSWLDPKVIGSLRSLQSSSTQLGNQLRRLDTERQKLLTEQASLQSMMGMPRPHDSNPQAQQQWDMINAFAPKRLPEIEMRLREIAEDSLSIQSDKTDYDNLLDAGRQHLKESGKIVVPPPGMKASQQDQGMAPLTQWVEDKPPARAGYEIVRRKSDGYYGYIPVKRPNATPKPQPKTGKAGGKTGTVERLD